MTPLEYMNKYRKMEVLLDDGPVSVDVHKYVSKCHSADVWKKASKLLDQKEESVQVSVRTVFGDVDTRTFDKSTSKKLLGIVQDPYNGKGSPEEVQVVLQLAVKSGATKKEELQEYLQSKDIGLDCCGFVSNYIWHAVECKAWDVDVTNKDVVATNWIPALISQRPKVKSVDDILKAPGKFYIMATADENGKVINNGAGAHVMITEPHSIMKVRSVVTIMKKGVEHRVEQECYKIRVIESTGGLGLTESFYKLVSVDKNYVFTVARGCKSGTLKVRIAG